MAVCVIAASASSEGFKFSGNKKRGSDDTVVALWDVQQVLPLLAGRNDGTGGGTGPIREVENGIERHEDDQEQHDGHANENQHCVDHDLPAIHRGPFNVRAVSDGGWAGHEVAREASAAPAAMFKRANRN